MTVVVGYLAGKSGRSSLHLAVEAARVLRTSLVVVTVVPKPWMTPSPAASTPNTPRGQPNWARTRNVRRSAALDQIAEGLDVSYKQVANRTAGEGLVEAAEELGAEVLVVGSSPNGALGQVVLGSTADWLLHASPVPVSISPGATAARVRASSHVSRVLTRARPNPSTWSNVWRRSPRGLTSPCG